MIKITRSSVVVSSSSSDVSFRVFDRLRFFAVDIESRDKSNDANEWKELHQSMNGDTRVGQKTEKSRDAGDD